MFVHSPAKKFFSSCFCINIPRTMILADDSSVSKSLSLDREMTRPLLSSRNCSVLNINTTKFFFFQIEPQNQLPSKRI